MYKNLLLATAISMMLLGCATANQSTASEVTKEQHLKGIEGTTWKLVSFGLTRMAVPKGASIRFEAGQYSGHGGCNGVGGDYTLEGEKIKLSAGFSTMMACPELDLEHKYMKALNEVDSYKIKGDLLDLEGNGRLLLRFKAE